MSRPTRRIPRLTADRLLLIVTERVGELVVVFGDQIDIIRIGYGIDPDKIISPGSNGPSFSRR